MADPRLLLDLPDPVWALMLQALRAVPKSVVNLELVCVRLRDKQRPLLPALLARLALSHQQEARLMHNLVAMLKPRMLAIGTACQESDFSSIPDFFAAPEGIIAQTFRERKAHAVTRQALVQDFGPSFSEQAQLIGAQRDTMIVCNGVHHSIVELCRDLRCLKEQHTLMQQTLAGL